MWEARGGFSAAAGNQRVTTYHFIHSVLYIFFCFFQLEFCFSWQVILKSIVAHFGHCGPMTGQTLKNTLNMLDCLHLFLLFRDKNRRRTKVDQKTEDFVGDNY